MTFIMFWPLWCFLSSCSLSSVILVKKEGWEENHVVSHTAMKLPVWLQAQPAGFKGRCLLHVCFMSSREICCWLTHDISCLFWSWHKIQGIKYHMSVNQHCMPIMYLTQMKRCWPSFSWNTIVWSRASSLEPYVIWFLKACICRWRAAKEDKTEL